ncbi:hypothetical protein N0V86_007012 [Didymella sp. IMI 355093]|nr:hypothetical protein N0V86_007012 [Didymella sp. IMI 355093]
MKNLDYPGAPDLFTPPKGADVAVNVFDYTSDKVFDHKVKNLKAKPAKYGDYVTEHIVELQTVKIFLKSVAKDAKIKAFIENGWNTDLDTTKVANGPNKPSITMGNRKMLNSLIFEALGSDEHREDFVLCESEINSYKARIWDTVSPMANGKYKTAVKDAVSGALDSNVYLSALRSTLAVFNYVNEKVVTSHLKASIKNVGTELKNIEHLTTEKVDFAAPW